ncbi:MAG TPA: alpha-1,4-glucan--maltose-1-phosphate maltosyltransferase, partial [Dehalococcoidia bacterium]|nr:alpha-1,4-glucan--maltose-1-phosphate maltosyltransferase [Dehalococcoidia bacterium]
PAKATLGEEVVVEADVFTDGTDVISAVIMQRPSESADWSEVPMEPLGNDRWRGAFPIDHLGTYVYTIEAWIDPFLTWRRDLEKRLAAGQKVAVEFEIGAGLVREAAARAFGKDHAALLKAAERLSSGGPQAQLARVAMAPRLGKLMTAGADRRQATRFAREVHVRVDPEKARFSAWYEMFPRSVWTAPTRGKGPTARPASRGHATFRDVEARLPYVAEMGFDVLYLPPIQPIGRTHRKGSNNSTVATAGDPGSPWAIGSQEGGHKAVNPALGTLADFRRLVRTARDKHGIDVALDIAYQCSPDHPYVREHPQWFRHRPDGTIQYAENPPKKYEDIYPFDFQTDDRRALWDELKSIVDFWIEQGVHVFRVDNPHTKPFAFWEWMLGEVNREHPEVIFLAEAFTRPKVMHRLAKLGFHQSYTYFAWRNQKWDLTEYLSELTTSPVRDFFRPNFWPNTPDILTDVLQHGGRPAFIARLVLAATMSSSYGIYGPAFELMQHEPREPGSEEYLHSEKYEIRTWDTASPGSLHEVIAIVNRARRDHRALQSNRNFRFHNMDNPQVIAYSKRTDDSSDVVLVVVNLDYRYTQSGWLDVATDEWGVEPGDAYSVHDLLTDAHYTWRGGRNFIKLDPDLMPAHIFVIGRRGSPKKAVS